MERSLQRKRDVLFSATAATTTTTTVNSNNNKNNSAGSGNINKKKPRISNNLSHQSMTASSKLSQQQQYYNSSAQVMKMPNITRKLPINLSSSSYNHPYQQNSSLNNQENFNSPHNIVHQHAPSINNNNPVTFDHPRNPYARHHHFMQNITDRKQEINLQNSNNNNNNIHHRQRKYNIEENGGWNNTADNENSYNNQYNHQQQHHNDFYRKGDNKANEYYSHPPLPPPPPIQHHSSSSSQNCFQIVNTILLSVIIIAAFIFFFVHWHNHNTVKNDHYTADINDMMMIERNTIPMNENDDDGNDNAGIDKIFKYQEIKDKGKGTKFKDSVIIESDNIDGLVDKNKKTIQTPSSVNTFILTSQKTYRIPINISTIYSTNNNYPIHNNKNDKYLSEKASTIDNINDNGKKENDSGPVIVISPHYKNDNKNNEQQIYKIEKKHDYWAIEYSIDYFMLSIVKKNNGRITFYHCCCNNDFTVICSSNLNSKFTSSFSDGGDDDDDDIKYDIACIITKDRNTSKWKLIMYITDNLAQYNCNLDLIVSYDNN